MEKIMFICFVLCVSVLPVFTAETAGTPMVKEVGGEWYAYMEFKGWGVGVMQQHMNTFMSEFNSQKLTAAGPSMTMYYNSPAEEKPGDVKWAYGFIVSPETNPKEPIKKMELKKQTAVVYLLKGPYENLPKAHEVTWKYIKDNGYKVNYPFFEKYMNNPNDVAQENLETKIIIPVEKCK
ncbi:MAG: GyrI-like domain-containing protein [Acidobacteria bacterium]|jgi:effector-binding domain-containing protein|nr:GyrI-like domain-containing protein [Acidobacteriota bacterium]